MLIFIPMAGTGDRYLRAGYTQPKPLIPVDDAPMIERVLDAFPRDRELRYLFGINRQHAETTDLVTVLRRLRPSAEIVVVDNHKDGPVQTVLGCAHLLPVDEDVCLNYCDFGVRWSFDGFADWLNGGRWDGAMSGYKGFHPHSLGPTLYAYMRNQGDRVTEIQEKHHFTPDKFSEYASSGLYWFRKGSELVRLAKQLVASGQRVNGEFYVSMLMQLLIQEGGSVGVYELERFFQWGTPEDLRDYESWSRAMKQLDDPQPRSRAPGACVVPMAGRGQRFADQGYVDPKPLIDVAGAPMIERVLSFLPEPERRVLVVQQTHGQDARFLATVGALPGTEVVALDGVTEGQAVTAKLGVLDREQARINLTEPVLFAPCDAGYLYSAAKWSEAQRSDADLIMWTAMGHLPAIWRPHMYGWLRVESAPDCVSPKVLDVAVKRVVAGVPLAEQQVITGTFWFRDGHKFLREVDELLAADDRVNGEFYLDTVAQRMVAKGAKVRAFCVDKFIPWGTPEELKTFEYWNQAHRDGRRLWCAAVPERG